MIKLQQLLDDGYDFFTGVPDSGLKDFIKSLDDTGAARHVQCTNEGHAIAMAFGAMLAGCKSAVYMQNSGIGNAINPIVSLCVPCGVYPLLIIGHRHTLPQHKVMGEIDEKMMKLINYPADRYVIVHGGNNEK